MKAKLLYKSQDIIGEGIIWLPYSKKILWVDIESCILHEYALYKGSYQCHKFPDMISSVILLGCEEREVLLTMRDRIICYNLQKKIYTILTQFDFIDLGFRINDAKISPEGRIWFGVMHMENHNRTGCLYCLNPDLSTNKALDCQCIPNGIVWNKTGDKMYYADSGRGCIEEFLYDKERGSILFNRVAIWVPTELGIPDGMIIDKDGLLWVAQWGGFGVYIWNPETGELTGKVETPVPNVASCTFGGKYNDTLLITTARSGLSELEKEKYSQSGGLFYYQIKT
ncbi:SMP-30/gluconolactonase/LRE family protein [Dysgonomonas sp. Marseille-P4677]|uniref:SMP-30/gluconolactonase/LRE family protein n=1 Tax=Dysgonomonas sp. Marseille-P4677 TaxID=2364790 RepID=UPI0019141227|nr:SMP-30/gluconolactonase/LRE family protein [Dysgonomonas sp. Marseille-P4677]MBK5722907.1 SMP-30/gluconolactonase/LRE family protein [Dysgonomonas sp. Marseille-P4677]